MVASGFAVAMIRRGSLLRMVGYLWVLGMVAYVVLMLDDPNPGSAQDDAAGAGAAILAIPWLVVVALLVTVGYGLGILIRRFRPTG
ncbi:MAG: hypothetical protein JWR52_5 [Marmoricola sp.]|nr:hypothetical protein [Marmoricola sp.]